MRETLTCKSLELVTMKVILNVHTLSGTYIGLDFTGLGWITGLSSSPGFINSTYDPQRLEEPRIFLHSQETPLYWTTELGKKAGGFAFCILVPEPRSATNTRYL